MEQTDLVSAAQRTDRTCRLIEWKPWPFEGSTLLGHATVSFSGWIVHRIAVFRRDGDGALSVGVPSAPEIDTDGRVKQRDGKRLYWPVVSFETKDARERWQRAVLAALTAAGIGATP